MEHTIIELFAGVGGFRLGFEKQSKKWNTVWMNQWEPSNKNQFAFNCYKKHWTTGINEYSNMDINLVPFDKIPDASVLVGGFPCQNYSVCVSNAKGIEGEKGVLWWNIYHILEHKNPPFVLLENVDRLLKSPAKLKGRDFSIILWCFNNLGYNVEWRIINASEYGFQQRRKRVFIFAYKKNTKYANVKNDFFDMFSCESKRNESFKLPDDIKQYFEFSVNYFNSGKMIGLNVYTKDVSPVYDGEYITLNDIMEHNGCDFILSDKQVDSFRNSKGSKEKKRIKNGFEYTYKEGAVPFPDIQTRAARTILTSEGSINRTTHVVVDKATGKLRLLTPIECERIQGFDDNWTNGLTNRQRYFCMGNALVVQLVSKMAEKLDYIIERENK